jgi:hypothetical protein
VMLVHCRVERMDVQFRPGVGKKEEIVGGQGDHVGVEGESGTARVGESVKGRSRMLRCGIRGRCIVYEIVASFGFKLIEVQLLLGGRALYASSTQQISTSIDVIAVHHTGQFTATRKLPSSISAAWYQHI